MVVGATPGIPAMKSYKLLPQYALLDTTTANSLADKRPPGWKKSTMYFHLILERTLAFSPCLQPAEVHRRQDMAMQHDRSVYEQ